MSDSDSGCVSASADDNARALAGWRKHLPVHPAAELFPMMCEAELRELGEDIKSGGLKAPLVLFGGSLLDGRNRLDAMELVGIRLDWDNINWRGQVFFRLDDIAGANPYEYVISANLHRRHLTSEQKRDLIAKVLKAKPEASNAAVAKQVKADDKTVAKVRRKLESTSEIPKLEKIVGADGKSRPKNKKPTAAERSEARCAAQWKAFVAEEDRAAGSAEVSADERREYYAATEPGAEDQEDEVAGPAEIEGSALHALARMNEHARLFRKLFRASTFDREAGERIATAIDVTIQKWRLTQSTLTRRKREAQSS